MPWRKPRFTLFPMIVLIAILAIVFGILPASISPIVAALMVGTALLASIAGPLTKMEWVVIIAIDLVLLAQLAPTSRGSHSRAGKPITAPTSGSRSGKL